MNKLKLLAGIMLLFCVGVFVGVLGTGAYFTHRFEHFTRGVHRPPITRLLMERLTHKLDLTAAQQDELRSIFEQTRIKLRDLRGKYQPEMESVIESGLRSVKEKLAQGQREKLDELYAKLKNRWRKREASLETGGRRTPVDSFDQLTKVLALTESQQTKVHEIIQDGAKDRHALIRKYRTQSRTLERSLRQEMKEKRDSVEKSLALVLTKEQMEQYREFEKRQPLAPYHGMHEHGLSDP